MSGSSSDSQAEEVASYNASHTTGETSSAPDTSAKTPATAPQSEASPSSDSIQATSVATGALSGAAAGGAVGSVPGAVVGAVLGAGISIFGQLKSASDQAEIDRKKAEFATQQANEIAVREQINDVLRGQQTFRSQLNFASEYAASGHEGAGIGSQLEIKRQGDLATSLADRDAAFQEKVILEGGKLQGQLAENTQSAGYFSAAGTAVTFAGHVASNPAFQSTPGQSQGLPAPQEGY